MSWAKIKSILGFISGRRDSAHGPGSSSKGGSPSKNYLPVLSSMTYLVTSSPLKNWTSNTVC